MSELIPTDSKGSERGDGDFVKPHLKMLEAKAAYYNTGTALVTAVSASKYSVHLFNPSNFYAVDFILEVKELRTTSKVKFGIFVHNHLGYLN